MARLHDPPGTGGQPRLQVDDFAGYALRPIATHEGRIDPGDVRALTEWRNRYPASFLTEFTATEDRTARWLASSLRGDLSRVLFMLVTDKDERIGHLGLARIDWRSFSGELDAIVSGGSTPRGLMSASVRTLIGWAENALGLKAISVRVLSDNPAMSFYRRLGFVEFRRVPLRRTEQQDSIAWIEDPVFTNAARHIVYMSLRGPAAAEPNST